MRKSHTYVATAAGVAWLALALALAACAPLQQPEYTVGRTRLSLPVEPGQTWHEVASANEARSVISDTLGERIALHSRTLALRGPREELLALLRVQVNASNYDRAHVRWVGQCPRPDGVDVHDATQGSTVRVDCLQLKRYASADWLAQHQPQFVQWLGHATTATATATATAQAAWPVGSVASFLSYRYASERGALVQVDVLADQRLLRPMTRNNFDFMQAGQPAHVWSEAVAHAARQSASMVDGFLALPPFPIK